MRQFKFNIGLNNNPLKEEQIQQEMESIGGHSFKTHVSEWEGNAEPTLIFTLPMSLRMTQRGLETFTQNLCSLCEQEAIAVREEDGVGHLIYNENYTGEKSSFNEQYFID
jgi:hypothetical protein